MLAASCSFAACSGGSAGEPNRPDIVFVLLDAVRADHLTPYGYARDTTPFLASLAARGVVFERAYAASTWTPSSMASVFTSLYVNQHGLLTGYRATQRALKEGDSIPLNRLPAGAETVPEALERLGYRTFGIADNVNISPRMGFERGFDRFAPNSEAGADALHRTLRGWRDEIRASESYFLYVHYNDAHLFGRGKTGLARKGKYRPREPWYDESVPPERQNVEAYDSNLSYMDEKVKELFEMFGLEEDALVVIAADHGEEFGDHGDYGHQNQLYEELLRVPLIVFQPGRLAPRRVAEPVSLIDLLPTFREAAGGKPSPSDQGVSLYKTIDGPPPDEPRTFFPMRFTESADKPLSRKGVVRGRWKYILTLPAREEELYDLEADPQERTNAAARMPEVVADMRGRLETFEKTAKTHRREYGSETHISPEQAEQLKALGYVQ